MKTATEVGQRPQPFAHLNEALKLTHEFFYRFERLHATLLGGENIMKTFNQLEDCSGLIQQYGLKAGALTDHLYHVSQLLAEIEAQLQTSEV